MIVFYAGVPCRFEEIECPGRVHLVRFYGVVDRDADSCLCRLVEDILRGFEEPGEGLPVPDVADLECKVPVFQKWLDIILLDLRVIVRVEVVQADDLMSIAEQPLDDMGADEPGPAGD